VSLLVFFVAIQFTLGITTIIIAHVAFTISFVTIVVRARLSGWTAPSRRRPRTSARAPSRRFCG
jgi:ABC-type spermidine/putrescine transport system permease subunit II